MAAIRESLIEAGQADDLAGHEVDTHGHQPAAMSREQPSSNGAAAAPEVAAAAPAGGRARGSTIAAVHDPDGFDINALLLKVCMLGECHACRIRAFLQGALSCLQSWSLLVKCEASVCQL